MQRLSIIMVAMLSCLSFVSMSIGAPLLNDEQVTKIARTWLGKPDWEPDVCDAMKTKGPNGRILLHMFLENKTDALHINRSNGKVLKWVSGDFDYEDVSTDRDAILKAFKAWAPTHVAPTLMAKLTMVQPGYWLYRQANGIEHPDTYVYVQVDHNGVLNFAEMNDEGFADYRGSIPITPAKAMEIAGHWVRTAHQTDQGKLTWPDSEFQLTYGFYDKSLAYPVPVYTVTCDLPDSLNRCGCASHFDMKVNAVTGEVWSSTDYGWDGSHQIVAKSNMLVIGYGKEFARGYIDGLIPLKRLAAVAPQQKLSAKAGDAAFIVDGKRVVLPSKVVSKDGVLYLPWQALKYLKGVKTVYYPKANFLQVTTSAKP